MKFLYKGQLFFDSSLVFPFTIHRPPPTTFLQSKTWKASLEKCCVCNDDNEKCCKASIDNRKIDRNEIPSQVFFISVDARTMHTHTPKPFSLIVCQRIEKFHLLFAFAVAKALYPNCWLIVQSLPLKWSCLVFTIQNTTCSSSSNTEATQFDLTLFGKWAKSIFFSVLFMFLCVTSDVREAKKWWDEGKFAIV